MELSLHGDEERGMSGSVVHRVSDPHRRQRTQRYHHRFRRRHLVHSVCPQDRQGDAHGQLQGAHHGCRTPRRTALGIFPGCRRLWWNATTGAFPATTARSRPRLTATQAHNIRRVRRFSGDTMKHVRLGFVVGVGALAAVLAGPAQGQLVGLKHLWTVPGAKHNSVIETFITCTNANSSNETIGVELYDAVGAFVDSASLTVAPGATVTFGSGAGSFSFPTDANFNTGLAIVIKGHVRVMSSATKSILCSAYLADTGGPLPTLAVSLTVAKKTKQKGD